MDGEMNEGMIVRRVQRLNDSTKQQQKTVIYSICNDRVQAGENSAVPLHLI